MKIIILVFQIWIISVYSSDFAYFDDILNENKTIPNNNPDNSNEDITKSIQDNSNVDLYIPYNPTKSNIFYEVKFNDKIHKEVDIYMQTKLMGIFNHTFNLMFDMIKENFGNFNQK